MNIESQNFNDNLKIIVCHECGRSLSFDSDENGNLVPGSMKVISQGDFFAIHTFGSPGLSLSVEVRGDDR